MLTKISIILCCFLGFLAGPNDAHNVVRVSIDGLRSDKGRVVCALYTSAEGFAKDDKKAIAHAESLISDRRGDCVFTDLQPGTYAIAVFHDENSNGRLDRNFLGIPREGVGASNNAKGHFGPPSFHDASFAYEGGSLDLKIAIGYL